MINNNIKSKMIYNIPYSPQFNPIEHVNNELKSVARDKTDKSKRKYF